MVVGTILLWVWFRAISTYQRIGPAFFAPRRVDSPDPSDTTC
jgi:hypothetical protein